MNNFKPNENRDIFSDVALSGQRQEAISLEREYSPSGGLPSTVLSLAQDNNKNKPEANFNTPKGYLDVLIHRNSNNLLIEELIKHGVKADIDCHIILKNWSFTNGKVTKMGDITYQIKSEMNHPSEIKDYQLKEWIRLSNCQFNYTLDYI